MDELSRFQSILSGHLPPLGSIFPGRDLHDQYAVLPKGDLAIPKGVVVLEQVTSNAVDMMADQWMNWTNYSILIMQVTFD